MTPDEKAILADAIEQHKTAIVALQHALLAAVIPGGIESLLFGAPDASGPISIKRIDGSLYPGLDARQVLTSARSRPHLGFLTSPLAQPFVSLMVEVRDRLDRGGELYGPTAEGDPFMQFVYHVGNGCAHGNRWHFKGQQPKRPAFFRGLSVVRELHGKAIFFDSLGPGEGMDLCDDLVAWLRK